MEKEDIQRRNFDKIAEEYSKFKEKEDFFCALGIIGGVDSSEILSYEKFLGESLKMTKSLLGKFAIVFGGAKYGIPKMSLDLARLIDVPTVSVYPQDVEKHTVFEKTNFSIPVPPQPLSMITWGVETPTLISIPDVFILLGGDWGTMAEISMIMKRNNFLAYNGLPLKHVIAIKGSGKLADNIGVVSNIFSVHSTFTEVSTPNELTTLLVKNLQNCRQK